MEWGRTGVSILARQGELVIIVDVLSFSTAVSVAVEHGAIVIPHRFRDDAAERLAQSLGASLAGCRGGLGPSLSPASLSALRPGDQLVLPSPNGATCSVLAADAGATVVAGCLRNATAVGRLAVALGGTTAVIPAGELWPDGSLRPAFEDLLGAGAILSAFGSEARSPEASAAVAAFYAARGDLRRALGSAASGRELIDAGFDDDVAIAAQLDATDLVPQLTDGGFRSR